MNENNHNDDKVIDLRYLSALAKGDIHFMREMIRIFLEENPSEILMLEAGIREKDFNKINVASHKLRSTAPFVGIDKIIEADITALEELAENNSGEKRIEIEPDGNPDIQRIEIVTSDRSLMQQIEKLFQKVKAICEKARAELALLPPNFVPQV